MSQGREDFMAKWGITSEQEMKDIAAILQKIMRMQLKTMRPKWSREFGEDVLKAIERMPEIEGPVDT
jgi:hypothetical protein